MAKRMKKLLLLLLVLPLLAATCQGTETNNPGNSSGGDGENCLVLTSQTSTKKAVGSDATLDDLILQICQHIIECGVMTTVDTCVNGLNGEDGDLMTDELGLTEGTTITQLREYLIDETYQADTSLLTVCKNDVSAVECNDITSDVSADDFSGTQNFIPSSCLVIFQYNANTEGPAAGGCP